MVPSGIILAHYVELLLAKLSEGQLTTSVIELLREDPEIWGDRLLGLAYHIDQVDDDPSHKN